MRLIHGDGLHKCLVFGIYPSNNNLSLVLGDFHVEQLRLSYIERFPIHPLCNSNFPSFNGVRVIDRNLIHCTEAIDKN